MLLLDLDRFHQAADQFAPLWELGSVQAATNLRCEVLQLPQHLPQVLLLVRALLRYRRLVLKPR